MNLPSAESRDSVGLWPPFVLAPRQAAGGVISPFCLCVSTVLWRVSAWGTVMTEGQLQESLSEKFSLCVAGRRGPS